MKRQPSEPRLFVVSGGGGADSDAALALAAARGNPAAAGLIWDRHARVVRGVLRRSLGAAEVEDHVQEVFLRFFRQVKTLKKPAALRCFLIGIAMRVAGTELRRRRVRRFLSLTSTGELEPPPSAPHDHEAREAVARLYALLDQLDTDSRLLFVLRYVEELELTEIAEARRTSLATTKRRLSRVSERVSAMARKDELLASYLANGLRFQPGGAREGTA